jgi:poly[(R)-3-hydroxyalkanoate] polymerase subunit PhaC
MISWRNPDARHAAWDFSTYGQNADTTRMTAGLHRDFLRLGAANALVRPGDITMLGSPVDLAPIDRDTYLVAGITDHICPWQSCYQSTSLLSGSQRFVLSTSGHMAAMVNPPGNDKASYQVAGQCPADPQEWLRDAETSRGSWWPDYAAWLGDRCGEEKDAPAALGGGLTPICDAPGTSGGHLELAARPELIAPVVEAYLDAERPAAPGETRKGNQ